VLNPKLDCLQALGIKRYTLGKIFVSDCSHPQRKSVWPNI
jgi:hypothetical protein